MNTFGILMNQMEQMVIYVLLGVLLVRTKVWNHDKLGVLAAFVLKLALPMMIFVNIVNGVTREILMESLPVVYSTVIFYVLIFMVALAIAKLLGLQGDKAKIYRAMCMFGNVGFMGIPIVTSIFPENGMVYISIYMIVDALVLWTVGAQLTSSDGKGTFQLKKMVNPVTVAVVLAVLMVLLGLPLPDVMNTALQKTGATATPLAMIYLGGLFACIDIRCYLKKWELYGIVLVKMCLVPVTFYLLLGLLSVSGEIRLTMALITGMPSMSALVMMAKSSGTEGDYAMGGVFVTTLCSLVTLPAVCWVLQNIQK